MIDPNIGRATYASRIPLSRRGWRWTARLALAVLACAFAGTAWAQTVYRGGLDEAVGKLTRMLMNGAGLRDRDKRVLVKSDDFFEMGTGLRLGLSEILRGLSSEALTGNGVRVAMSGSDEDEVRILHGRWRREPDGHLYLELSVAAPVESGDPTALRTVKGLVPIDESIDRAITATLDDWGRLLVLRLERGVRDQKERRLHLQPMTIEGDGVQGGGLERSLTNWLGKALVESRLFTLVEPPPGVDVSTDGELHVAAAVSAGQVEVSLRVLDHEYQRVTFATIGLDQGLFPPGVFPGPGGGQPVPGGTDPGGSGGGVASGGGARPAPDALHRAAQTGDLTGLQGTLAAGADVDARDGKGWTALMHAVAKGYPLVVEPLLKAGADPDLRAPDGATALFMAAAEGHAEIIERLMEAEADVSIRGPEGRTAVDLALTRYGDAETARRSGEPPAVLALLEGMSLDDAAFARAEVAGTAAAYAKYRSSYPQGRHSEEAGRRERERTAGRRFRDCVVCPKLVVVPEGSFLMGSPSGEAGRGNDEGPVHRVRMARPLAVGVYEVTFGEWEACVSGGGCGGYRPDDEGWGRGRRPVIYVSWEDAKAYVEWLSGETGQTYRLLSESEWEYVARAETRGPFHTGWTISTGQANYDGRHTYGSGRKGEYRRKTEPVGSFPANGFGLHDVLGNVWEWVEDCWNGSYEGAPADGSAWESGDCERRVLRGGSWSNGPGNLRSAFRIRYPTGRRHNFAGFRVARTLTP